MYVQQANSIFAGQTTLAAQEADPSLKHHELDNRHSAADSGWNIHERRKEKAMSGCQACGRGSVSKMQPEPGGQDRPFDHDHFADSPSGEDMSANYYGVDHFPCCITNFPQGWPKFAQHVFVTPAGSGSTANDSIVVAILAPASAQLPGGGEIDTTTSYPFDDTATIRVTLPTSRKAMNTLVRIPGWADAATINGKAAPNGTLVTVACAEGATTTITVDLKPEIRVERHWGRLAVPFLPPVTEAAGAAAFDLLDLGKGFYGNGSWFTGSAPALNRSKSGAHYLYFGAAGSSVLTSLEPLAGAVGKKITGVSMAYQYIVGRCALPSAKPGPTGSFTLALVDQASGETLKEIKTPLSELKYCTNKSNLPQVGYSPPMTVAARGLAISNTKPVLLRVTFTATAQFSPLLRLTMIGDNDANCSLTVQTSGGEGTAAPVAPAPSPIVAAANSVSVVRGPLVFALHPAEDVTNTTSFPPVAGGYGAQNLQIGTSEPWNFALVAPEVQTLQLDRTPIGMWSEHLPFDTTAAPFSIAVKAKQVHAWTTWVGSTPAGVVVTNITAEPPASPVDCSAAGSCGEETTLKLVPYGGTNIRLAVLPWVNV